MRLAITLRLPHLRQRSRLTKWLMGAPGLTPKRMRSRSEMTLLCRHDRHRIEIPWGGRGVICLWYIVPRTTMATFWRPRVGGQELEAKSAKRMPSVGLRSGRDKAGAARVVKATLHPGGAGGSKQFFVLEKQDLTGGTGAGGGRLGGDERRDGGATCKPRPRRFLLSVCRRELP